MKLIQVVCILFAVAGILAAVAIDKYAPELLVYGVAMMIISIFIAAVCAEFTNWYDESDDDDEW